MRLGEGSTFSARDLSLLLERDGAAGASTSAIERFWSENGYATAQTTGERRLNSAELDGFLEHFALEGGHKIRRYNIPDSMRRSDVAWVRALVRLYESKQAWPAAMSPPQGEFLRGLVSTLAPRRVLEIGCSIGASSVWMASALQDAVDTGAAGEPEPLVHTMDLFEPVLPDPVLPYRYMASSQPIAQQTAEEAGLLKRIRYYKGDSRSLSRTVPQQMGGPIDLLFIDGDHTTGGCLCDLLLYYPHVAVGGYILLHDIYPDQCSWDGPRWVIDNVLRRHKSFEVIEVQTPPDPIGGGRYGMALARKIGPQQRWTRLELLSISARAARQMVVIGAERAAQAAGRDLKLTSGGVRQMASALSILKRFLQRKHAQS